MLSSHCAGPVQCVYFAQTWGLRSWGKPRLSPSPPPPFGFHTQALLSAACFAKFGQVRPLEGMVCAKTAHVPHIDENQLSVKCVVLQGYGAGLVGLAPTPPFHPAGLACGLTLKSLTRVYVDDPGSPAPCIYPLPTIDRDLTPSFFLSSGLQNCHNLVSLQWFFYSLDI